MQFARNVHFQIKNGKTQEFTNLMSSQVLPMLRKQTGFKNELALTNGNMTHAISLWESETHAKDYANKIYPEVLKALSPVIEGTPKVDTYEVTTSTLPAAVAA